MKILTEPELIVEYIDKYLVSYHKEGKLYPFIGAGFTKGSKSRGGHVPDGNQCINLMKQEIISANKDLQDIENEKEFDQVASIFYDVVPIEKIVDFIASNFTKVQLDTAKKQFVNLKWNFIYTLNIDDAIERNSQYAAVLPNRTLIKRNLNSELVFKLHGDAHNETTYPNIIDGIIFSRSQYLKSINLNKDLLNFFYEDFSSKNFLFIGCSLDNEIDLEFLLANDPLNVESLTDKIYLTSSVPTGVKKLKLKKFGITTIIVTNNYDGFFNLIVEKFRAVDIVKKNPFDKFIFDRIEKSADNEFAKKVLLGEIELSISNNIVKVPHFFIDRAPLKKVLEVLKNDNILFVVGKRVSGKTFFLFSVANAVKNKTVYFFPSKISLDSNFIDDLLGLKKALIIFDTDTISSYDVEEIYYRNAELLENDISFLFCINSSDRLMLSVPYSRIIDKEIVEVDSFLNSYELDNLNSKLSRAGFVNYKANRNILSNIVNYKLIYNNIEIDIKEVSKNLDSKTLKVFILNAVFDKTYSGIFRALLIDNDNLQYATKYSNKAIEFEYDIDILERGNHASFKLITNSKAYLFSCLGEFIQNKENVNVTVKAIVSIVDHLKQHNNYENSYKALITFDNLNEIFYKRYNSGAMNLIFLIYQELEPVLFNDSHYWMQRAKSILYLKEKDVKWLLKAIEFALKPYHDSKPETKLHFNSGYQISTIYLRIINIQNFHNVQAFKETVKWFCLTFKDITFDNKIISNLIEDAHYYKSKNDFYNFCHYLLNNKQLVRSGDAEIILQKFFGSRFN